MKLGKV